jgi:abhydrolase domain-containing protein 6
VLRVSRAKILEAVMPNAKVAVMDAVGHLPMIEKPKETAELYLSFLEQREPNLKYVTGRIAEGWA